MFNDDAQAPTRLADHSADWRMAGLAAAALAVGSAGVVGAWLLIKLIALATNLFWFGRLSTVAVDIKDSHLGLVTAIVPVVGSVVIGVMARFGSDKIRGHGIPEAIEAILYGESKLSPKVALLKPLSSAISIGSGGPFGAEGPIIMTGGAIGSLFAQCFHLSAAERKTLLVAGAAAGMTGIFGTPLAAILLAVEVLLFEWKPRSFVPVVVAVLVSAGLRPFLLGSGPLFPFAGVGMTSTSINLPLGLLVGVVVGLEATLLSQLLYRVEDLFHRLPVHWMWWPSIGGVVVGVGGLIDIRVLGAGYGNIQQLLDGSLALRLVISLLIVKAVVWLVALGSGTSGGVLAPLLILGGALGYLLGMLLPGAPGFWAMMGMAAIMSGAMRAPLTGAFFAVELTAHFDALPIAMAASAGAYAVSVLVMQRSILTEKIARRGRHILQEYTVDPLDFLQAGDIMTADPAVLPQEMTVDEALDFFSSKATHRSYPVVNEQHVLIGLASRGDALRFQATGSARGRTLGEALSDASQPAAYPETPIGIVADIMVETGVGRIPIIDQRTRVVRGILSRHDLLKARGARQRTEIRARPTIFARA
ncbi:chloride channel protein [Sphingomonas lycopersici]|uniref:Chloride channel protein n=1 Tax=Sphingomonas lycopersici TaxID=2951807 RepID=A0AA41ZIL8_9SPHN|nr:chloride channel protein [Sphingomonas lycopersici]MCW6537624.1 chloride channel protein [Sphingomonas lycopersici]